MTLFHHLPSLLLLLLLLSPPSSSSLPLPSTVLPHSTSTAPPLILLHGLFGTSSNLSTLARTLSSDRTVHSLTLRNHAGAPRHFDMSFDALASDVAEYMTDNGIGKAVIIGHSIGGKVAMALATGEFSKMVDGVIVVDIAPVEYAAGDGSGWSSIASTISSCISLPLSQLPDRRAADAALALEIPDPSLRAFVLASATRRPPMSWLADVPALSASLETLASFPSPRGRSPFAGDAYFVAGGNSKFVKSSHVPAIAELFPSNMIVSVRGAGHWVHAESPNDVAGLVRRYLERERRVEDRG